MTFKPTSRAIPKYIQVIITTVSIHDKTQRAESSPNYETKTSPGHRDDDKIKFSFKGFLKYFVEGIVKVGVPIVADAVVSNVVKKSRGGSSIVASPESSAVVDHSVERNLKCPLLSRHGF